MVQDRQEPTEMRLKGTIIDIESIGEFDRSYPSWDPRQYANIKPTIFGYITYGTLVQYCAEGEEEIGQVIEIMSESLPRLENPFFALNCDFERNIISNNCGLEPHFLDVRGRKYYGSKWTIREELEIPTYDDPFDGDGYRCLIEWKKGNFDDCLKHNRACLLIERDIQEFAREIRK